jgi:hypothetical protein
MKETIALKRLTIFFHMITAASFPVLAKAVEIGNQSHGKGGACNLVFYLNNVES